MTSVGFTDGAFQNYTTIVTNITECRANSVRFVKQVKLLEQARQKMRNDTNQRIY